MKEKIDLQQIIIDHYGCKDKEDFIKCFDISVTIIEEIMLEYGKQLLELAADNAKHYYCNKDGEKETLTRLEESIYKIDKSSILTVINHKI